MSRKSERDLRHRSILLCTCDKGVEWWGGGLLVSRETNERYEKRKQEMWGKRKHQVAKGCKQITRCDRQPMQVTKITANAHKLQMLQKERKNPAEGNRKG